MAPVLHYQSPPPPTPPENSRAGELAVLITLFTATATATLFILKGFWFWWIDGRSPSLERFWIGAFRGVAIGIAECATLLVVVFAVDYILNERWKLARLRWVVLAAILSGVIPVLLSEVARICRLSSSEAFLTLLYLASLMIGPLASPPVLMRRTRFR